MFSHPAALLCNAGAKRGGRERGGGCGRMVAAHPLLPASRLSEPRSLLSLASSRQPSPFYIQSRHATMNSTNYVAFSFAALFDRPSARAVPRRVIIPRREEESNQREITVTDLE